MHAHVMSFSHEFKFHFIAGPQVMQGLTTIFRKEKGGLDFGMEQRRLWVS